MKLKVLAEAGPSIGLGHFMRSLSLAQMVRSVIEPVFFGQDERFVINTLTALNIDFQVLSSTDDFLNHVSPHDVVVLDGYHYDSPFQKEVQEKCRALVIIDDKHDKLYCADYIINPAPGVVLSDYSVNGLCHFLLGPDYALLRPSFLKAQRSELRGKPHRAVVCFGGADPKNLSFSTAEMLLSFQQLSEIHVIVGAAYGFDDSLKSLMLDDRLKVSNALSEVAVAEALSKAHFAVVPASGVLYECLGVGTPAIAGYYIDNQIPTYRGWLEKGAIIGVADFEQSLLRQKIQDVLSGAQDLSELSNKKLIDKKSPDRFVEVFRNIIRGHEA